MEDPVSRPCCASGGGQPVGHDPIRLRDGEVCAVCGMSVSRYPEWVAEVVCADGSVVYFDGPTDLFRFLRDPGRYAGQASRSSIVAAFVTGYYDRAAIPARDALFVVGSDVVGPLGAELVPHGSRAEAEDFMVDHRGKRILSFDEASRTGA